MIVIRVVVKVKPEERARVTARHSQQGSYKVLGAAP
jgi:hypothetical protein